MTQTKQDLDQVREYYCAPRPDADGGANIYEIWESGGAFNDSITPSTYVPEYRSHVLLKLLSLTPRRAVVFSFGCGNGFVEGDLVDRDRQVRAIDCNEEAVELTRRKGVDAWTADFHALAPAELAGADVVYADGFLGHVFDPETGVDDALRKLAGLGLAPGTLLLFSNDSPGDPGAAYAPHPRVEGFWFISRQYLAERLAAHGFETVENYYFPYLRPISGMRNRTIVLARVP